jgi:hypothetical protein
MGNRQLYTLRIWIEEEDARAPWRALLEDSRTGHRWGFTRPEELVAFLAQGAMASPASRSSPPQAGKGPPGAAPNT